ncbi:ADP-ribosylglycohydrolase family protein [Nocardia aurantia]|uniref:ADP-ribosyl-[dinitrogen reductase] glycohydrolase n=1 Tax=Nocardia aurantia TaxID=2585199 RepID=A0A7K0DIA9_9NOCA|nr:ADP-ribosylglycohydrolase family protein [Nocardia aurantia]MQY25321.1 ADP-ribosyl-[dinitrogen reductase] glycohydrolase [Nocardia aurantia]
MPLVSRIARDSLEGLSVGDALGAQFFVPGRSLPELRAGRPPAAPWEWTDDTEMACSVFAHVHAEGRIDRDGLAATFADRCEPYRGYSGGTVAVLHEIRDGRPWADAAGALFDGRGSWGNGAAMRVAPLGAYFAGDLDRAAAQAALSAEVTHRHPEAIVGAMVVASAASCAAATRGKPCAPAELLRAVEPYLIDGRTATGVRRAGRLLGRSVAEAAYELGNGAQVSAQDTVPFTLWAAATFFDDYPAAVTACVEAGGDADTTAAIVGGIVAARTGIGVAGGVCGIPLEWLSARESLPAWISEDGDR